MPYIGKEPARVPFAAEDIPNDSITAAKIVDGAITIADIADDAVTEDKLANAINTAIAANTAKVTNATHTGDVTGATTLTIATDAVDIGMLSATGTASSTTFLRGDNTWVTPTDTNTVYTHPNHSGDVVSAADGAMTIQTDAVDIAMLSATGTAGNTTFLRGDNTWATAGSTSASDLTSGTLPGARLSGITVARTNVTTEGQVEASTFVTADGSGYVNFGDNEKIRMGAGNDLQLYHDASNSYISDQGTGDLRVLTSHFKVNNAANNEQLASFIADGASTLFYDGAAKIATTSTGINVTGTIQADNLTMLDNEYIRLGDSNDLSIYHGSGHTRLINTTGNLTLQSDIINLANAADSSSHIYCNSTGVGISTTSPGQKLHVAGNIYNTGYVNSAGSGTGGGYQFADGNAMIYRDSNDMVFKLQGAEKFRLGANGNASLGTTTLNAKLNLSGAGVAIAWLDTQGSSKNWALRAGHTSVGDFAIRQSNSTGGDPVSAGTTALIFNASRNATFSGTVTATSFTETNSAAGTILQRVSTQAETFTSSQISWDGGNSAITETTAYNSSSLTPLKTLSITAKQANSKFVIDLVGRWNITTGYRSQIALADTYSAGSFSTTNSLYYTHYGLYNATGGDYQNPGAYRVDDTRALAAGATRTYYWFGGSIGSGTQYYYGLNMSITEIAT